MSAPPALRHPLRDRPGPQEQPGLRLRQRAPAGGGRRDGRRRGGRPGLGGRRRHHPPDRRPGRPPAEAAMLEVLAGAIRQANDRIADLVEADYSLEGMGTTVTGALFDGSQLGLAHIGDSRAYLLRDGRLERLTHDHSWVQSLVDDGKISPEEAAVHPHRSLLLKVLNGQPANDPDLTMVDVRAGDRLLFCSDGLCGLVDDPEIAVGLAMPDLEDALRHLVDEALDEGGIDNITVILADVLDDVPAGDPTTIGAAAERDIRRTSPTSTPTRPPRTRWSSAARRPSGSTRAVTLRHPTAVTDATGASSTTRATDASRTTRRATTRSTRASGAFRRPLVGILVAVLVARRRPGRRLRLDRAPSTSWGPPTSRSRSSRASPSSCPASRCPTCTRCSRSPVTALPPSTRTWSARRSQVASLDAARQTVASSPTAAKDCASVKPSTGSTPRRAPRRARPRRATTPPKTDPVTQHLPHAQPRSHHGSRPPASRPARPRRVRAADHERCSPCRHGHPPQAARGRAGPARCSRSS